MRFESEAALQAYCLEILKHRGIEAQSEVWTGKIRADIVTADAVYELKKVLNRESIYQAFGQACAYNKTLNKKYICIVGQAPIDPAEFQQGLTIAKEISSNEVRVSFIEHDPFWSDENAQSFSWISLSINRVWWRLSIAVVLIIAVLLIKDFFEKGNPPNQLPAQPQIFQMNAESN